MAYNELLANRVREAFMHIPDLEEIKMFQGLVFMVNGKMCVGVRENKLMCRLNPNEMDIILEKPDVEPMMVGTRTAKGYVFVSAEACNKPTEFNFWIQKALEYNPFAKASKKKQTTLRNRPAKQ